MEFSDEQIIEEIYKTGIFADIETGSAYKKLLHKYNVLFDSIKDSKLKSKFEKLEQLKMICLEKVTKTYLNLVLVLLQNF